MGKLFKGLVKFSVAAATVGGLCYVFKDQIRESKVYKEHDMDDKIKASELQFVMNLMLIALEIDII